MLAATLQKTVRLDSHVNLIEFAMTWYGKLVILFFATLGLSIFSLAGLNWWPIVALPGHYHGPPRWPIVLCALTATTYCPQWRKQLVLIFNGIGLFTLPWFSWSIIPALQSTSTLMHISLVIITLSCIGGYLYAAKHYSQNILLRRPLFTLIFFVFALLVLINYLPATTLRHDLWGCLIVLCACVWFIAYTLQNIKQLKRGHLWQQFYAYLPFWGSTTTPIPKGVSYMNRIEAKDARALAVSQLRGLQLLYWSLCLSGVNYGLYLFYLHFQIPQLPQAFARLEAGHPYAWHTEWIAVLLQFAFELIAIAMYSHLIIAICRLAGFNALRNMDSPLTAPTIVDFWNRYYYYFKELLVEFFFYPTYFRYFKQRPKLRVFMATMMAACLGNVIFHFLASLDYIAAHGLWQAVCDFQVYLFYSVILGIVIAISQLRKQSSPNRQRSVLHRFFISPLVVIGFYCIMTVFNRPYQSIHLTQNLHFLMSLFFL